MFGSLGIARDQGIHVIHHWLPSCKVPWAISSPLRESSSWGLVHKGLAVSHPIRVTAKLPQGIFNLSANTIPT